MTQEPQHAVAPTTMSSLAANTPPATPPTKTPEVKKADTKKPTTATTAPAADGEKKLTGAQLKARKKAEKAARRAQTKQAAPPVTAQAAIEAKKARVKDSAVAPAQVRQAARQAAQAAPVVAQKEVKKPVVPECFSHLPMAKRIQIMQADKEVHPAVVRLGQSMAYFEITDSIQRLEATLNALRQVIEDYTAPRGTSLSRHFTPHVLNANIEYLAACRPLCYAMGNAIRRIKTVITKIEIDTPEAEAKEMLLDTINRMVHERIHVAEDVIFDNASMAIDYDSVILTYSAHRLVEISMLRARSEGRNFRAIIIDDPFQMEGLAMAKKLKEAGIHVTYYPSLSGLRGALDAATLVMVGAEAMFSNGAMYARSGTADLAIASKVHGIRLVALNQSINFSDRMTFDSFTYNEIDPDLNQETGIRLLFDVTRPEYISSLITDYGDTSLSNVAKLRQMQDEN